jgi:hypothetical protein
LIGIPTNCAPSIFEPTFLHTSVDQFGKRVRPHLSILLECKRAELPWLFFQSTVEPSLRDYPRLEGLNHSEIRMFTDIELSTTSFAVQRALSLDALPFLSGANAPIATSISRLSRKESELELSGTDAFATTVLPLVKAGNYFATSYTPKPTYRYFELHAVLFVCALEAPMILATVGPTELELKFCPWVRLVRQEPIAGAIGGHETATFYTIDFVHSKFFATFLDDYVKPFSEEFATRVYRHPEELAQGRGFIQNLDRHRAEDPEAYLKPAPVKERVSRARRIGSRLVQLPRFLFTTGD